MFFKSLYDVARHTAMTMIITPHGERLRVIVTPKPGKDAKEAPALSKPIEATGTPEELDAELPKAIAAYAAQVNDLRATISVPTAALDAAKAKAGKTKPAKPPKAAKKPRAPKAAKPKKAPKPKPPAQAKPASAATAKKTTAGRKATTPRSSLPGKDKYLEDLRAYMATGKDLNRAAFIAWARKNGSKTGRRFEKLWSGWHEFIEQGKTPASGAPRTDARPPSPSRSAESSSQSSRTAAAAPEPAAKTSKTVVNPADKWPFPVDSLARTVRTDTGTLLGNCDEEPAIGDTYKHPEFGEYRVVKIEKDRYIVQRPPEDPAPADKKTADLLTTEGNKQP